MRNGQDRSLHTKDHSSVGATTRRPVCRGGFPRPPVDFDVILRNGQDRSLRVVGAIHESPTCHSEPTGEESRFAQVYFVLLEILRFAQDDKLGFVGMFLERTKYRIRVGRGLAPAVSAPSDEGAVKCVAFDWGRDFFHFSPSAFCLRQKPPPSSEGGIMGRRGRRPLRTKWNAFAPRTPIFPCVSAPASVYQTELRANSLLQQAAFPCIIKDRLSLQTGGLLVSCVVRSRTTDAG